MALKLSTDLKNYVISKTVEAIAGTCGTAGTASVSIYNGSQPADADTGTSGTQLVQITGIGWAVASGVSGGTAALASTAYVGTAGVAGTAGWARMILVKTGYSGSAATFTIDGDVGTAATNTFQINSTVINAAGLVTLLTAPISIS